MFEVQMILSILTKFMVFERYQSLNEAREGSESSIQEKKEKRHKFHGSIRPHVARKKGHWPACRGASGVHQRVLQVFSDYFVFSVSRRFSKMLRVLRRCLCQLKKPNFLSINSKTFPIRIHSLLADPRDDLLEFWTWIEDLIKENQKELASGFLEGIRA